MTHSDPDDLVNSREHWQQLNDWLITHQEFWRPVPFMEPDPAWGHSYPELAQEIAGLSNNQCDQLADNPAALAERVSGHLPSLGRHSRLVDVPVLSSSDAEVSQMTLAETRAKDMPGRKRLQSGAFAATLAPFSWPALDWCCGKGHLSRTLASGGDQPVLGFEWSGELVDEANRLADYHRDPVIVRQQNVMAADLQLPENVHGVALHACGDLHRQLIRRGCEAGLPRLSFSPCCYHLGNSLAKDCSYHSLSTYAKSRESVLTLFRNDIRLAVQETVTAPARVREQNSIISQWRLGFDSLQQCVRGIEEYLPVPSYAPSKLHEGFKAFCYWAAAKKELTLPNHTNFDDWLIVGAKRLKRVRRHELLRHVFRRPLELWLVLDYVMFLEEQGYQVRYGQFCDRSLTPRNLMIDAVLMRECNEMPGCVRH